jgi:hypothetical protein
MKQYSAKQMIQQPDAGLKLLLAHMKLSLPTQPPPKNRIPRTEQAPAAMPL